jgi:ketosteroid isomerase-like protein
MKYQPFLTTIVITASVLSSCQQQNQTGTRLSKTEMMKIVIENDNKFSTGIKRKDAGYIANIYTDSAQYVQPKRNILVGKDSIRKDWENFIALKEKPVDLILTVSDVRGDGGIIYETGKGYTLLTDSTKWEFNYVNVWRLQNDGSYKLEIDTYN